MHAKCEVSISYGSKAIVKVKVDNRQTNKQTGQRSKIEKVPRGIRGEKSSKDMASSRNLVSTRMFLLVLYPPPHFEAEYCLFCGRRRVAVARYRIICLVQQLEH